MHPKIITALTLVLLGTGAAHAAPTNSTPARAAAQTTNQTAPTPLQQNLLTLIKAGQAMEAETQVKQAEIEKKYQPKHVQPSSDKFPFKHSNNGQELQLESGSQGAGQ